MECNLDRPFCAIVAGLTPLHCAIISHNAAFQTQNTVPSSLPHLQDVLRCVQLLLQLGADYKSPVSTQDALTASCFPYQSLGTKILGQHPWAPNAFAFHFFLVGSEEQQNCLAFGCPSRKPAFDSIPSPAPSP